MMMHRRLIGGAALPSFGTLFLSLLAMGCGAEAMDAVPEGASFEARSKRPSPPGDPAPSPTPSTGGSLRWQLQLEGPYSAVRPAIGPDGSVYAIDAFGTLYAASPAGALRWRVAGAGSKGLAVGSDGTVYVGSEDAVRAFAPDGALRWTFVQSPRAFILLGLSVGPDGNLYGVATQGLGVFSLTPEGSLRWTNPESYARPNVTYGEVVFGPNGSRQQLYFYANAHVRAVDLSGRSVFAVSRYGQPAVSPLDGSVHVADVAYRPDGSTLWSFGLSASDTPDVGADGVTYVTFLWSALYAIDAKGAKRWSVTASDWIQGPVVDPTNRRILLSGTDPITSGGVLLAYGTNGARLWRLALPEVNGTRQVADTRARFSADGATAYLVTTVNTGTLSSTHAYLTAIGM